MPNAPSRPSRPPQSPPLKPRGGGRGRARPAGRAFFSLPRGVYGGGLGWGPPGARLSSSPRSRESSTGVTGGIEGGPPGPFFASCPFPELWYHAPVKPDTLSGKESLPNGRHAQFVADTDQQSPAQAPAPGADPQPQTPGWRTARFFPPGRRSVRQGPRFLSRAMGVRADDLSPGMGRDGTGDHGLFARLLPDRRRHVRRADDHATAPGHTEKPQAAPAERALSRRQVQADLSPGRGQPGRQVRPL